MDNNYYEKNMYRSTAETVKSEVKTGLIAYAISSIFSKIFALIFGGVFILLGVLVGRILRFFMTEEEREQATEKVRLRRLQEEQAEFRKIKQQKINNLLEIKRLYNEKNNS